LTVVKVRAEYKFGSFKVVFDQHLAQHRRVAAELGKEPPKFYLSEMGKRCVHGCCLPARRHYIPASRD